MYHEEERTTNVNRLTQNHITLYFNQHIYMSSQAKSHGKILILYGEYGGSGFFESICTWMVVAGLEIQPKGHPHKQRTAMNNFEVNCFTKERGSYR